MLAVRQTLAAALVVSLLGCGDRTAFVRQPYEPANPPQLADVDYRVFLIGDVGDDDDLTPEYQPALRALERELKTTQRTTVVFLGDLIYEDGYPAHGSAEAQKQANTRLASQLRAVEGVDSILIPGNHDWARGHHDGWDSIRALGDLIAERQRSTSQSVRLAPSGGCPGPVAFALGATAEVIAIDTQWWLHEEPKPSAGDNPTACPATDEQAVLSRLREQLVNARREGRRVILAGHHPLRSHGAHGGFFDWQAQIFPFTMLARWAYVPVPGIGSLVTSWRARQSWMNQDLSHPAYQHMLTAIEAALRDLAKEGLAPLVYAAGHEHSLQVLRDPQTRLLHLISGQGSAYQSTAVTHGDDTLFSHARGDRPGFMELRFLRNGRTHLTVYEVDAKSHSVERVFTDWLS